MMPFASEKDALRDVREEMRGQLIYPASREMSGLSWFYTVYHISALLTILFILILVAILLWKKVRLMEREEREWEYANGWERARVRRGRPVEYERERTRRVR